MSSVIRSLMVRTGADLTAFQKGFAEAAKKLKSVGKQMESVGKQMTNSITKPALAATAGVLALSIKAGQAADELLTLSAKTGLSTDALQELEYAARFVDVEVETMTDSMIKLTKNMDNARKGTKDQMEAFEALNVQYKNADGTLRNAKEVWADTIDALSKMTNEADRDAYALRLFGRSAAELNPLIAAGGKELNRLAKEAHDVGAVMGADNVKALGKFDDSMQRVQAVMKKAAGELAVALLPLLNKIEPLMERTIIPAVKGFVNWVGKLVDGFSNLSPFMQKMITLTGALAVGMGPLLQAGGGLVKTAGNISSALAQATKAGGGWQNTLSALLGPAGMVAAAIAGLALVVGGLVAWYQSANAGAVELNQTMTDMVRTHEAATKAFSEQSKEIETNTELAGRLTDELYALNAQESKTEADKVRMKTIIGQLNEMYEGLNLSIDTESGKLNKSIESTKKWIDEKKRALTFRAYEDRYLELLKQQIELEDTYLDIQKEQKKYDEMSAWRKQQNIALYGSIYPPDLQEAMRKYNEDLQENAENLDRVTSKLGTLAQTMRTTGPDIKASTALLLDTRDWASGGYDIGAALLGGITQGIIDGEADAIRKASASTQRVLNAIKSKAQIASPSKITRGFGRYIMQGLGVGFGDELSNTLRRARSATAAVMGAFTGRSSVSLQTPQLSSATPAPVKAAEFLPSADVMAGAFVRALTLYGLEVKANDRELGRVVSRRQEIDRQQAALARG